MSGEERALLERFVVDNEDLERLEALLAEFNVFEALGAVRQELRHSDFLAFLLDPSQNHGLGDAFLKRLLKRLLIDAATPPLSAVEIDVTDLRSALVQREWQSIDILVHDPDNHLVFAIENKIGSGEHSGQLHRYWEMVTREFLENRTVFVYLTPEGDQPSHEAYIPFSYAEIADLVDAVRSAHESTLGPDVCTLMTHYTAMLRRHIVSESEIAELCRKIYLRHRRALDLIFEHRPDLQWDLAESLKTLVENAGPSGLVMDHSGKGYVRFALSEWDAIPGQSSGKGWTRSGRILLFEFENAPDRLQLKLLIGPGPDEVRQAIHQVVSRFHRVFRGRTSKLYPRFTTIYKQRLLTQRDYEDADVETLTEKVQTQWERFLGQDLPTIREAIAEVEWPELPESPGT
jgi:hypothetical protein